ncbi:intermembrane phospholipid transport protein YdbH family protein [Sphingobium cloacae]|nr:YdbH domain-containing protein [Sphingobium cloacae]
MEEEDGDMKVRRNWLRWLGAGIGLLALVLVALWTQRAPIAENFISRELNRRGVEARYELARIGLRTQRIENISLGDPADPDFTARWVEVDIAFAGVTPQAAAVRAGGVRMRASLHDGVLDLGELDKFRDPASTAPFSLPDIVLALNDARVRLDTDAGAVGMRIDGQGHLQSGFRGKLAAVMPRARLADCGLAGGSAWLDIRMNAGQPRLSGPLRGKAIACRGAATAMARPVANIDLTLGKALDRWTGTAQLGGEALKSNGIVLASPSARIGFDGTARGTGGQARVAARAFSAGPAMAGQTVLKGTWNAGADGANFQGDLSARHIRALGRDPLASLRESTAGSPVGPLGARLADALKRAGEDNLLHARLALVQRKGAGSIVLNDTHFSARSGARVDLSQDGRFTLSWPGRKGAGVDWALDGAVTTDGGGLPRSALRLAKRPGGGFGGQWFVDPYKAAGASLSLEPVRFAAGPEGQTRFSTVMRLDGPLPDGGIKGLSTPVEGVLASNGALSINPRCIPLSLTEARYGGFALGRTRQTLCPLPGGPMLAMGAGGGLRGGVSVRNVAIDGRSGSSPMRLQADEARFVLGQTGFQLANAAFTVGPQDAPVRLAAAKLDGRMSGRGFAGRAEDAGGRIGAVPLIVEKGRGDWRFADGVLTFKAALSVRDAQDKPRFNPLDVPDFTLTMKDGRIAATGNLRAPRNGALVARADIAHDLNSAKGHAVLSVPGLVFDPGLQPDDLTGLTLGVVANVAARISGEGHIRWSDSAVTSDGVFRTDNADLAAAFGPVQGLSGELRFTDLLGLVSAPGQEVRIKSVNPGVEVRDGVVRYRLEPDQHVHIEGGGWPFAGGQLVLLPTTMDFSADVDRYMTFRVLGLDAGAFIQAMELENVSATGTFDGIMPLIFNARGGRVSGGVLVARQQGMPPLMMPEGVLPSIPCDPARQSGVLSYVGPVSNEQLGVMGKMAFDALKDLQYKCLTILLDGALDGEMVTNVVFNGVNRGKLGDAPEGIARSFIGLPFIFNVRIAAPFRGLMGTAQSLVNPNALLQNSVGDEVQQKMREGVAVQPAASDTMSHGERK